MNAPTGRANIVGIHPFMTPQDYSGAAAFYNKLDYYFTEVKKSGMLRGNSTVLLPEHFGTWLVAAEEKKSVYEVDNIESAIRIVAISNIFQFGYYYFKSDANDRLNAAIFQMKAKKMANIYQYAFSRISKKFEVHIVAGSILLPDPKIVDGKLEIGEGALKNVSVVFTPDGSAHPSLTIKKFLSADEVGFVEGGTEPIPVYHLPTGSISILLCEDSWYQQNHDEVLQNGAKIILSPAYLSKNELWESDWKGLNPMPDDIDKGIIGSLSEAEAWHKYSLSRNKSGTSISVFMSGKLWDIGSDGKSFVYVKNQIREVPDEAPFIFNTWIY